MSSSVSFTLELNAKGHSYNVSLVASMNNGFHLVLDDCKENSSLPFVVDNLPVFLVSNTGFYLGVRYYIKVLNPSTGHLSYFQKSTNGRYTATETTNNNCLAFTIFKPTAYWKEHLELVTTKNLDTNPDVALFNFSINDCPKIDTVAFHKFENPTTGVLTYSVVQCFDQMSCTSCGNPACPLGTMCATGLCTNLGKVDFTLRIAEKSREYILVYEFSKCGTKLMFSSIPIEEVSGSIDDPFNYKFRILQSDQVLVEGVRSPLYVVRTEGTNVNTKYYLSNPKINHKSKMTEYTLTTNSQSKNLLAVNSKKTGLWRTYVFDNCDFENLIVPPIQEEEYCDEKGGPDSDSYTDTSSSTGNYFEESSTAECNRKETDSTLTTNDLEKATECDDEDCDCDDKSTSTKCCRRKKTPIGFWGDVSLKDSMVVTNSQMPPNNNNTPTSAATALQIETARQANARATLEATTAAATHGTPVASNPALVIAATASNQPAHTWPWWAWVIAAVLIVLIIIIIIWVIWYFSSRPAVPSNVVVTKPMMQGGVCRPQMKAQQVVKKSLRPVTTMETEKREIEVQVPRTQFQEVETVSTEYVPVRQPPVQKTTTVETLTTTQRTATQPRSQTIQLRRV